MTLRSSLTAALAASALVSSTFAQATPCGYEPNIGTGLALTDDSLGAGLALGFPFTFPNGTVTSSIDVDSNGRILLPGADPTDYTETVAEFLADPSSICPYWDDLNPNGTNADDVYFNALPGKAVITWKDIVIFGGSSPFTFQVTLWADSHITVVYDERTPRQDCLVGLSVGGGAADPGALDYTARPMPTGGNTFYELFTTGAAAFDIPGELVDMIATGGNYILTRGNCATNTTLGDTCMPVFSMLFAPNGAGGYRVLQSTSGVWTTAYGTNLGLTDDMISTAQPLGFSFTFPGGASTTDIVVDSNGRILVPGADTSDLSPTVAELLTEAHGTIAPFWTDLNPNVGGAVYYNVVGGIPTVSWIRVPQFGTTTTSHSFQVQLMPGDVIRMSYLSTATFDPVADNLLVGVSGGNGVTDPGSTDWTASLPLNTGSSNTAYEYFGGTSPDFTLPSFALTAANRPVLGTNYQVGVTNFPAGAVTSFYLIGVTNPGLDLTILNLGLDACTLHSSGEISITVPITANASSLTLGLPNLASLAGRTLYYQSAALIPNVNLANLLLTNGIAARMDVN